jgi:transcriptional regulator with XRE-family HTH domain
VDDLAIGRLIRLTRIRRRLRQEDLAAAAGVSRATVSRLERGRVRPLQVGTIRALCEALGLRVVISLRGEAGELDRLSGEHHSAMHEEAARLFDALPAWVDQAEVTFSVWGERGSIDILAWHAATRSLLVIELKTELVDVQDALMRLDRKERLAATVARERGWEPATVSVWLLVAESSTNRRRVAEHAAVMRSRLPADGRAVAAWLRRPAGRIAALSFLSSARRENARQALAPVRRVRVRRSRTTTAAT